MPSAHADAVCAGGRSALNSREDTQPQAVKTVLEPAAAGQVADEIAEMIYRLCNLTGNLVE